MKLSKDIVDLLKANKNLLAFSHQIDSTALFYILKDLNIPFDVAMVDYKIREESCEEVRSAKALCEKYSKKFYLKIADKISNNFEANARKIRYNFFNEIIGESNYTNLLTGHQLNDRLEWFLMQFGKGAGICELKGMDFITKEDNYNIVRPMLEFSKDEIISYLDENKYSYFLDKTNSN